jgi:hypothetical protein
MAKLPGSGAYSPSRLVLFAVLVCVIGALVVIAEYPARPHWSYGPFPSSVAIAAKRPC